MNTMNGKDALEEIFCSLFKLERGNLEDGMNPDKVELWDSISHMELVSKLEEAFKISFDAGEITAMDSLGEIKKILSKHGVVA